jgi:hypothetical protein
MVQTAQILDKNNLWLHRVWQPQIRRIWGCLPPFWRFAIPKLVPAKAGTALEAATHDRTMPYSLAIYIESNILFYERLL